jgi:hypothetical protein
LLSDEAAPRLGTTSFATVPGALPKRTGAQRGADGEGGSDEALGVHDDVLEVEWVGWKLKKNALDRLRCFGLSGRNAFR